VGSLILLGFGFALFSSPNTNAIMSSVEKKFYGVASGTLGTMRSQNELPSKSRANGKRKRSTTRFVQTTFQLVLYQAYFSLQKVDNYALASEEGSTDHISNNQH